jgi:hypothetical protein
MASFFTAFKYSVCQKKWIFVIFGTRKFIFLRAILCFLWYVYEGESIVHIPEPWLPWFRDQGRKMSFWKCDKWPFSLHKHNFSLNDAGKSRVFEAKMVICRIFKNSFFFLDPWIRKAFSGFRNAHNRFSPHKITHEIIFWTIHFRVPKKSQKSTFFLI